MRTWGFPACANQTEGEYTYADGIQVGKSAELLDFEVITSLCTSSFASLLDLVSKLMLNAWVLCKVKQAPLPNSCQSPSRPLV
jgi:hypothetical protein